MTNMKNEYREKETKIVLKPKKKMLKFFHNEKCKFNEIRINHPSGCQGPTCLMVSV